jgi:hypothetical protein
MKTSTFLRTISLSAAALGFSLATAHADAPAGRFVIGAQGQQETVFDTKTHLTWERTHSDPLTASAAKQRCAAFGPGWRVPTVKELYTIVDFSVTGRHGDPLIDERVFGDTPPATYWTTLPPQSLQQFQCVSFFDGTNGCNPEMNLTRCVR